MSTIKTRKRSLSYFDDKKFYLNNIKSYPHDENLSSSIQKGFNKKICKASLDQLMDFELDNEDNKDNKDNIDSIGNVNKIDNLDNIDNMENKDNKDNKDNKYNKDLLINNILELTIKNDTELIEAAIRLYNDL